MSNIYEQMLLTDKVALESKIANLLEEQLNNSSEATDALNQIAKVIKYSLSIYCRCSFEVQDPLISGYKRFCSIEDYKQRSEDYYYLEEAGREGVVWWDDTEFPGSFSWDERHPEVSVEVLGLTEDASEEAKTLWEAQSKEQERQEQLDWKRKRLERAQKELLELQAELSAAEATA